MLLSEATTAAIESVVGPSGNPLRRFLSNPGEIDDCIGHPAQRRSDHALAERAFAASACGNGERVGTTRVGTTRRKDIIL